MREKSRILKKANDDESRPVAFNDSFGGSERQLRFLLKNLKLILSGEFIQKILTDH